MVAKAEEGRGRLRKARGRCLTTDDPGISEWGNPHGRKSMHRLVKIVAKRGARGEVKHLSSLRKRNQKRFPK